MENRFKDALDSINNFGEPTKAEHTKAIKEALRLAHEQRWRDIESEKPINGTWLLAFMGNCPYAGVDKYRAGFVSGGGGFLSAGNMAELYKDINQYEWITHWMPLPPAPTAQEGDRDE